MTTITIKEHDLFPTYLKVDFKSKLPDEQIEKIKRLFKESIQGQNWRQPIFLENEVEYLDFDMTKNHLIIWPDKILELVSKQVDHLSRFQIGPLTVEDISKGMFEVMYANKGVGLSAIQIGIQLRMFVMDCSKDPNQNEANTQPKPMVCINPIIDKFIGDPVEMAEGCLSFPGVFEKVKRYPELIFTCENLAGEVNRFHVAGLESQCVAHEIEHLNGITFATNWGNVTKGIMKRKIKKILG